MLHLNLFKKAKVFKEATEGSHTVLSSLPPSVLLPSSLSGKVSFLMGDNRIWMQSEVTGWIVSEGEVSEVRSAHAHTVCHCHQFVTFGSYLTWPHKWAGFVYVNVSVRAWLVQEAIMLLVLMEGNSSFGVPFTLILLWLPFSLPQLISHLSFSLPCSIMQFFYKNRKCRTSCSLEGGWGGPFETSGKVLPTLGGRAAASLRH